MNIPVRARRNNGCLKIRCRNGQGREGISITLKFLADENISNKVVNALRSKRIDIIPIKELTSGISDETILEVASKQNRVVITFDANFGDLVFRQKLKSRGVILLKLSKKSSQHVVDTISNLLMTKAKIEDHFLV